MQMRQDRPMQAEGLLEGGRLVPGEWAAFAGKTEDHVATRVRHGDIGVALVLLPRQQTGAQHKLSGWCGRGKVAHDVPGQVGILQHGGIAELVLPPAGDLVGFQHGDSRERFPGAAALVALLSPIEEEAGEEQSQRNHGKSDYQPGGRTREGLAAGHGGCGGAGHVNSVMAGSFEMEMCSIPVSSDLAGGISEFLEVRHGKPRARGEEGVQVGDERGGAEVAGGSEDVAPHDGGQGDCSAAVAAGHSERSCRPSRESWEVETSRRAPSPVRNRASTLEMRARTRASRSWLMCSAWLVPRWLRRTDSRSSIRAITTKGCLEAKLAVRYYATSEGMRANVELAGGFCAGRLPMA